jgi:hypothetical protein
MTDDPTDPADMTDPVETGAVTDTSERSHDDPRSWVTAPGTTLVVGPSNVGKTTWTARVLERWVAAHGPAGVVVLDFGPEVRHEGRVLGGRLAGVTDLLNDVEFGSQAGGRLSVQRRRDGLWYGVLDAHAPRAAAESGARAVALAGENARAAARLFDDAPADPRAVFVNDATIALQHPSGDPDRLLAYCARAEVAVVNAFESDELGTDDAVSRQERLALDALVAGADRIVRLP